MNTFMPYLDAFTHLDEWNDIVDDSTVFEENIFTEAHMDMPSAHTLENKAYAYEMEVVVDEEDDFFIG